MCFTWATSRSAACLDNILPADFSGTVQCDGYAAYPAYARNREGQGLVLAGCWAHVRRKFYEAKDSASQQVGWVLLQIGHIYRIEARLRESRAGPRLRQAVRAAESRPILKRLHQALSRIKLSRRHLPKSALGRAIDYALSLWLMLEVYGEDGRVEIDNNTVGNAIRPTAIGRRSDCS